MSGRTYKSVYYHIVFRTKNREPYLRDDLRKTVYQNIWEQCKKLECYLYRIGGNDWHVHLLVNIPPKIAVAKAVQQLKGASSHFVNRELTGGDSLYWQEGYGLLTLSDRDFKTVHEYIKTQDQRHRDDQLIDRYEQLESEK
jgi:putative transposase